ncbi:MAG: glycosyltransferase family 39 protein [Candidatus Colwellbacteria bacterium]|jgi:4-amino-4-deoxy-L-arabinose transferase-like glycosyltransferase|nr:glycosyltransferase family 39 protein [Candidatus Colwellbacteria bacterium]MDD3752612.1 glycosyltransferase family 39 protein [Candidatus Colwellbacteria bacterium]MDD4818823.1 glycosyltransferase family 39 protein [Candidatus Colwellbacteria bacterium]
MKKETRIWLLAGILIIASFFRLYNLKEVPPGLYPDEAMNGNNAVEVAETGNIKSFYPENNGREGLFINIQALFIKTLGENEPWVLRSVSALFGIASVLGIYFLASELLKENKNRHAVAILSAFLMAGSFWHILFSRIGFRAIMAPAFLIWSAYLLLTSFQKEKWKWLLYSLSGGFIYGLGLHSYIAYRATPIIIAVPFLFFFIKAIKKRSIKKFAAISLSFIAGTLIAAYPLISHFTANPEDFFGRTSQISVFSSETPIKDLAINTAETIAMFNFSGDANWRHNFSGYPELSVLVGIFFIIGLVLSVKKVFTNPKKSMPEWLIGTWLIVSLLPVVISNEGIPHALRAILAIPPAMILAAIGMEFIARKAKIWFSKMPDKKKIGIVLFKICSATIISFLIIEPFILYFILWGKNPHVSGAFSSNYVEIGRAINSLPKSHKKFVVVLAGGVSVRNIPMPAQTVMFITDSFTEKGQQENNIHYFTSYDDLPDNKNEATIFVIN